MRTMDYAGYAISLMASTKGRATLEARGCASLLLNTVGFTTQGRCRTVCYRALPPRMGVGS